MSQVMSPTDYVIKTRFDVGNMPGFGPAIRQVEALDKKVSGLGMGVGSTLNKLIAGVAVMAGLQGVARITQQVAGLNSELQQAEFGIATLFSALGKTDFGTAMGGARSWVKLLREDAAKGAGELSDYMRGFQVLLGPVTQGGASLEQVRQLNRMSIAAGGAMQGQTGMRLAPMDIVQALRGGVDEKITPYAMLAVQSAGISKGEFKAMDTQKRVEALIKGFGSFEAAANAFGTTWDARVSQMRDRLKDIARTATQPMFESWTNGLAKANDWLERNKKLVDDIARGAGGMGLAAQERLVQNAPGVGTATAGLVAGAAGARGGAGVLGALGVSGGALGIGAAIIGGTIGVLTGALMTAVRTWPGLGERLSGAFGRFTGAFLHFGETVLNFLQGSMLVRMLGLTTGMVLTKFLDWTTKFLNALSFFVDQVGHFSNYIWLKALEYSMPDQGRRDMFGAMAAQTRAVAMAQRENFWKGAQGGVVPNMGLQIPGPKDDSKFELPPVNNFNGPITVKIEAERLDDPNVVAVTMETVLKRLQEHPRSVARSRYAPKPK
jgi:hypothetical protein